MRQTRIRQPAPRRDSTSRAAAAAPALSERMGRRTMEAIVHAAAIAAASDGVAGPEERRSLIAYLRERDILNPHGRAAVLLAWEQALTRIRPLGMSELCTAADELRHLRGSAGARHAAQAAIEVAMADGVLWPQEEAMLAVIADRLGLRARPAHDHAA